MAKDYIIDYVDEIEFKKLEKALRKYNMVAFKKLKNDYYPALRRGELVGRLVSTNKNADTKKYEIKLPCDKMFVAIHGEVKLLYTFNKKEKIIMLKTIIPTEILLEGSMGDLRTYKGILISKANASKDKFKIDLLDILNNNK